MKYEAGDPIWYRTFGGGLRRVLVDQRFADVKHGQPGFDGTLVSGPKKGIAVWGYDHQIVARRLGPNQFQVRAGRTDGNAPGGRTETASGSTSSGRRAGRMSRWA